MTRQASTERTLLRSGPLAAYLPSAPLNYRTTGRWTG